MPSLLNGQSDNNVSAPTMRAVVWKGKTGHVSVDNVPRPKLLSSEDAIVRLTSAGICGTDLHIYRGIVGSTNPPWVLGHEGVGIVESVGEAVQNVKPGDRVIVPASPDDGVLNIDQLIPALESVGLGADFGSSDGLQAEYFRVTQADTNLIKIPHYPSRELDYLMISDIWGTAWTCLDLSGFRAGETVAVFGAGPVGLLCAYTALFRGAARVYVVDHVQARLNKAKDIGAIPINLTKGSPAQQILKLEPNGVDRSCDCCGYECVNENLEPQQNHIINNAVAATARGGGIGLVGIYIAQDKAPGRPEAGQIPPTLDFPMSDFWSKGLTIKAGVVNPQALAPQLVELVKSGRAKPGCITSSVIGIEEVPEGYRRFNRQLETKVVIRFPWEDDEWSVDGTATVLGSQRREQDSESE
ncbi:alcohol dehydrogenase GroES-like domain-containing protein [Boeremia exigua]|uniref:alcohol dehydrogenase GroES-like domain-containing protein n=1 Tax=Boeremia exigua TaxID=749465 RepID=UPI001E8D0C18|nr:alcohol dehydrogenase GroES-like domain-containing protein [Boeremia exigua]KAH6611923.1 alcohol dehydrogenase GroES-like domain-containing protein [Boeremia exigua]